MISVVTPSYRQLDWLRLAMASVADQRGIVVEHIVQDAGTPGIKEVFRDTLSDPEYANHTQRLFEEKDKGMYDAVNKGLQKAQGEICAYLNCDEQYLPGALAKAVEFFDEHPETEVLFGDVVLTDAEGAPISYRRSIPPRVRHIRQSHLNTLSCAMFFRRALLDRGFYFDPEWKDVGDAVWIETLLKAGTRMDVIPEPLAVFAWTGQNRSKDPVAQGERSRHRGNSGVLADLRKQVVILEHRLRKAAAGAYRRRDVRVSIYTLESPDKRVVRTASNVGFGWPT